MYEGGKPLLPLTSYVVWIRASNALGLGWPTMLTFTTIAEPGAAAFYPDAADGNKVSAPPHATHPRHSQAVFYG